MLAKISQTLKTVPPTALFEHILDSLDESIAVIGRDGRILYVNRTWQEFWRTNDGSAAIDWVGIDYLSTCHQASANGDPFGQRAHDGIGHVMSGHIPHFSLEYPCHSPNERRWFLLRCKPFQVVDRDLYVISHHDITQRKVVEEEARSMALEDSLTGIANRRAFDEFLGNEWKRAQRMNTPISIALLDLDYFKQLNDRYGHPSGDLCLQKIAELLKRYANRPSDLCCRYGGEEFALIWGDTDTAHAVAFGNELLQELRRLRIPNKGSPLADHLTASIGIACKRPSSSEKPSALIHAADAMLYKAKAGGRDQVLATAPISRTLQAVLGKDKPGGVDRAHWA